MDRLIKTATPRLHPQRLSRTSGTRPSPIRDERRGHTGSFDVFLKKYLSFFFLSSFDFHSPSAHPTPQTGRVKKKPKKKPFHPNHRGAIEATTPWRISDVFFSLDDDEMMAVGSGITRSIADESRFH